MKNKSSFASCHLAIATLLFPIYTNAQTLSIEEYHPPSTLVVPEHIVTRAKYPFIDVHNHQWRMDTQNLDSLIAEMDSLNMAVMVNLSGRGYSNPGNSSIADEIELLRKSLENIRKSRHDNRLIVFTNIRFEGFGEKGWVEGTVKQLEADVQMGAKGLKIYKNLGFSVKDQNGQRVPVDDLRLDPIWEKCGELGIPVLIHSGDPFQFWLPKDKNNERWLELKEHPERYRDPAVYPPWEQIMSEQHNVFRKHPKTIFISAHLSWMGYDLEHLGKLLDEIPNMYTEIGAVLAELGRQPRFAREWFIKYQDRVLFGKDLWYPKEYHVYFRTLERADEYFDYYRRRHAFWKIYGLDLPDEVLKKLYYRNALKILPGVDASMFPQ